ncbi:MAG: hypothetical protein IKW01_03215, partial [Firmicutes bacterium]|nr:hypothetical protein [Bacillota bacterium]
MDKKWWDIPDIKDAAGSPLIKETLRYLGYGSREAQMADERTLEMVIECAGRLAGRCRPRHISRRVPLLSAQGMEICLQGNVIWESESLARALGGCREVMVFG